MYKFNTKPYRRRRKRLFKKKDLNKPANRCINLLENLKIEIQDIVRKQNTLLDSYLDSVIDPETYKQKKNQLFETKLKLQEEITKFK